MSGDSSSTRELRFDVSRSAGDVSAVLERPGDARAVLVLAHGAGAGMRHPFLEEIAARLARRGIATFRYQFPYTERGRRSPDAKPTLLAAVRAAIRAAGREAPGLPLFAGGKSMGGRMTSEALAAEPDGVVHGLIFLGFPLHAAGKPGVERGEHLRSVQVPMLFLQGTRDALADRALVDEVVRGLGRRASVRFFEGADHSFRVPRAAGTSEDVLGDLAAAVAGWIAARAAEVPAS